MFHRALGRDGPSRARTPQTQSSSAAPFARMPCEAPSHFTLARYRATPTELNVRATPQGNNMPKLKTHKTTAKRFKVTGTGKLRRRKGHIGHNKMKKSKRVLREMRGDLPVADADVQRIERLLGKRFTRG